MKNYASPLSLRVLRLEKANAWQKDGRSGVIYHAYGQVIQEDPAFPIFVVISAPQDYVLEVGAEIPLPLSGSLIRLGKTPSIDSFAFRRK